MQICYIGLHLRHFPSWTRCGMEIGVVLNIVLLKHFCPHVSHSPFSLRFSFSFCASAPTFTMSPPSCAIWAAVTDLASCCLPLLARPFFAPALELRCGDVSFFLARRPFFLDFPDLPDLRLDRPDIMSISVSDSSSEGSVASSLAVALSMLCIFACLSSWSFSLIFFSSRSSSISFSRFKDFFVTLVFVKSSFFSDLLLCSKTLTKPFAVSSVILLLIITLSDRRVSFSTSARTSPTANSSVRSHLDTLR
mmetsp:Transcript_15861/g.34901  ORF Transcript_15861/g.34901 Transcript_15861/m.34901 type:complete len:250 (+) Transcript_15861:78-827(+)